MPKKKTQTKVIDEALKRLNKKNVKIDEINTALNSKNYSELTEFILRFSATKDCQKLLQVLAKLQENPQYLCGENEYETIRLAANIDGERGLVKKFVNLIILGMDQNRGDIENIINKNNLI